MPGQTPRRDSEDTRQRVLEAGRVNVAAINYHFGGPSRSMASFSSWRIAASWHRMRFTISPRAMGIRSPG